MARTMQSERPPTESTLTDENFVAGLFGLLLGGCSGGAADDSRAAPGMSTTSSVPAAVTEAPSTTAAPSAANGEVVEYEIPDVEASIAVPADWVVLTLDDLDSGAFDDAREAYPEAVATIDAAEADLRDGDAKLFGFEPESGLGTEFIANLSVVHVPGRPPSVEQIAADIRTSVEQEMDVVGEVDAGTATVSAGEVALLTYVTPAGEEEARITQFAYPRDQDGFILTLTAPETYFDEYSERWHEIADSVRY
jgi:hypothetical protein